ncbi:hypothetical protein BZM26_04725 [Paraburkholderia strydomiana]|nr:hypothetical protein BZM26_04725 [Paraburkholderia strydomiana]
MNTDQVISLLAAGLVPQSRRAVLNRFCIALTIGVLAAFAAVVVSGGVQPDLAALFTRPLFWGKLAFPLMTAVAAILVAARLSIPGLSPGRAWFLLALPYAAVWAAAIAVLAAAPAADREALFFGHTWRQCPLLIALLSVPCYLALSWAMRGLAPTWLRLTGATTGLLSGALATLAYVLRCPEMSVPFWAAWYSIGMAIPALAGYLLARVSLRWS